MDGRLRLLFAAALVGCALFGPSLVGCGDSPAEPCQDDNDCLSNEVCTADGVCVGWGGDAGSEADGSGTAAIDHVDVTPAQGQVGVGLTMMLEADAFDADGDRVPTAIFDWESSDEEIVEVDDRGVVEAVGIGTATVTARPLDAPEVVGVAQMTVVEGGVASVIVEPDPLQVIRGTTEQVEATAYNAAVEPVDDAKPVWRVEDEEIATVDANGQVEGLTVGTTQLIANVEGVEGSATLEVVPVPVDRVEISPEAPTVADGESIQLEASGYDGDGDVLEGREVEWASADRSIARVDADGLVTGVSVGTVDVGAKMGVVTTQVTVTVVEANQAPIARDHIVSVDEDTSVDLTLGASDPDGDEVSFAITSAPSHGTLGTLDPTTGEITYTPARDYVGNDSFTFTATDGEATSAEATVTLRIGGVNDAPVPQDDAATTDEDISVVVDVLANDSDPDGDSLTLSMGDQPQHGTAAVVNDAIEYTPEADFHGSDSFTYEVSDGNGGAVEASVAVTVDAVGDAPEAQDDSVTLDEDTSVDIDVLQNDTDADGDSLSVTSATTPANGAVSVSGATLTYTPAEDYHGSDSFEYTVSDGTESTTAAVSVTVDPVNDAPQAEDDAETAAAEATITIEVLANDTDVDTSDTLSVSALDTDATAGTASLNSDGSIAYTAPASAGQDTFGYTISDGNGGSDEATVTVTVE